MGKKIKKYKRNPKLALHARISHPMTKPRGEYPLVLAKIVEEIGRAKITVARVVNTELIALYWRIGKMILEKQKTEGWGEGVIEKLSHEIEKQTGIKQGFSTCNLWFMKQFYEEYSNTQLLKQLVSELKDGSRVLGVLPWGHHILLMQKTKKNEERIYYTTAAPLSGWSRMALLNQVKANAFKRHRQLPMQQNFHKALPAHLQEQAEEMLKSNYNHDFIGINKPIAVSENQLQSKVPAKLQKAIAFGFSIAGNNYGKVQKEINQSVENCDF